MNIAHQTMKAPLLQWQNTIPPRPKQAKQHLSISKQYCHETFATALPDDSMQPEFWPGTRLIICPKREPYNRCYVLVQPQAANEPILRQLLIDTDLKFLKPLHPDLSKYQMQLLNKEDTIIGVLIEARRDYGD